MLQTTKKERINTRLFKVVHGKNLIYNTCWEDPALDRVALQLKPDDCLVVISSAGCNAGEAKRMARERGLAAWNVATMGPSAA